MKINYSPEIDDLRALSVIGSKILKKPTLEIVSGFK